MKSKRYWVRICAIFAACVFCVLLFVPYAQDIEAPYLIYEIVPEKSVDPILIGLSIKTEKRFLGKDKLVVYMSRENILTPFGEQKKYTGDLLFLPDENGVTLYSSAAMYSPSQNAYVSCTIWFTEDFTKFLVSVDGDAQIYIGVTDEALYPEGYAMFERWFND